MVFVYSSQSNRSRHVIRELYVAVSKEMIIIPFRIEKTPMSKSVHYLVGMPHWLDAITPPMEKHIEELARAVKVNLDNKSKNSD